MAQEIRIDRVGQVALAQIRSRMNAGDAHL
jgi:hypothetical protein